MQCLEFFAGIGGFATAFPHLQIVQAIDIDRDAANVYQANHTHPFQIGEIASLPDAWFQARSVDAWWMSPPCTPFTRKGKQGDLTDARCDAFKRLVQAAVDFRPKLIAIENVVGFEESKAFELLLDRWSQTGYSIDWMLHCPSELGWPNRRPRFYAVASLNGTLKLNRDRNSSTKSLLDVFPYLQKHTNPSNVDDPPLDTSNASLQELLIPSDTFAKFASAMHVIDLDCVQHEDVATRQSQDQTNRITACFTSSYGKAILRSGSYLKSQQTVRRFSPNEIARLLGFPRSFIIPDAIPLTRQWHLLGNSLSLLSVREVFRNCFAPDGSP